TTGYAASKTYNKPGNRVVRLYVYDSDGTGYTDDDCMSHTINVTVKLTQETDWMTGQSPYCTTEDHWIVHGGTSWGNANYKGRIQA
ncbi:unnamed protein product, partial [marine sediment metagenome]